MAITFTRRRRRYSEERATAAARPRHSGGEFHGQSNHVPHTRLVSAVLAGVISSSLGLASPASATEGDAVERGAESLQLAQACGTLGPYATIRRANEVAYEAGSLGYSTQVFHNGDGYYVRAC